MPPPQSHLPQDRATHIPSRIQQEMDMHLQQTLPAHLKYYQSSGDYVPPHIQQEMAQHMQQSMPEHLKQYISPYMQQRVVPQHLASTQEFQQPHYTPSNATTYVPDRIFVPSAPTSAQAAPQSQVVQPQATVQPSQSAAVAQPVNPQTPYDFITNPQASTQVRSSFLSGKSLPIRLAMVVGGLVVLFIIFAIAKSILGGGGFKLQPFEVVLEDQQEIIHLTSNALQPQNGESSLSDSDQNFVATTNAVMTSDQSQLTAYLTTNKQTVTQQELNLKVSTSIDDQLTAAQGAGNYTTVFEQTINSQLNGYAVDIQRAYLETTGKKGRAQLSNDYAQAGLLLKQLNSLINNPGS